jgi:hypothetical protein
MKHYQNLKDLLSDRNNLPVQGPVFIQEVRQRDIENAEYWVMSSKEKKELPFRMGKNGDTIPETIFDFNVKSFLSIQTLQDIIVNKLEHNPNLNISDVTFFVEAINYYLENDDFLD